MPLRFHDAIVISPTLMMFVRPNASGASGHGRSQVRWLLSLPLRHYVARRHYAAAFPLAYAYDAATLFAVSLDAASISLLLFMLICFASLLADVDFMSAIALLRLPPLLRHALLIFTLMLMLRLLLLMIIAACRRHAAADYFRHDAEMPLPLRRCHARCHFRRLRLRFRRHYAMMPDAEGLFSDADIDADD